MEDYAAKMLLKSDAALREYVTGYAQYREAAVLAAFDELRRRGQPAPEEAALRPELEAAVATAVVAAPALAPAPAVELAWPGFGPADEAAATDSPALYSPGTILLFSVFFSMLAGGVLLGLNLGRLRRWGALVGLVVFIVLYQVGRWLVITRVGISPPLGALLDLPAILVYLRWFWPRYLGAGPFRSRSWLPPAVVCLVVAGLALWSLKQALPELIKQQPVEKQAELRKLLGQ